MGKCRNNEQERYLKKQSKNKQNTTEDDLCIATAIINDDSSSIKGYLNPSPVEPNFGFLSYSYLHNLNLDERSLLSVDGSSLNDDRYQFSRYLYLFTTEKIMIDFKEPMCDFLGYILDNAKTIALSLGYKPIPSGRESTNQEKFQKYCAD